MANRRLITISYIIVALVFILAGWLQLGTMLVAALFSYFVLKKMSRGQRKWVPIALFMILVVVVLYGFGFFAKQAIRAMPDILRESAPIIVDFAEKHNIPIPFTDAESLKSTIMDLAKDEIHFFSNFAKIASRGLVLLIMGFVVAMSLFLNSMMDLDRQGHTVKNNCYSALCDEIVARFKSLFHSFDLVLGAQLLISLINTVLTAIYLLAVGMPYAWMIVVATFLCGLLPIIGNLISNTIIVGVAFTKSPQLALASLIFLIVVHKLEYFLNSKIIGNRIKNPVWLTLIGIILGERLLGIPGMILAPVVLHFVKHEMSRIEVAIEPAKAASIPKTDVR